MVSIRGVADGGGGWSGGVLTPHFLKPGVDSRTFYDIFFSFALNCTNIKQTIKLIMLMKGIPTKDEVYDIKPSEGTLLPLIW